MRVTFFIICLAVLVGCKQTEDVPEGILTQNEIVPVLLDIYISESRLIELKINRDTSANIFKTYEGIIFERNNMDKEKYKKSLTYYYEHTDKFEKIYEAILDSLTLRESKLKSKKAEADSLAAEADSLATEKLVK